jgi:ribosome modulation factor
MKATFETAFDANVAGITAGKSGQPKESCPYVQKHMVLAWLKGYMFGIRVAATMPEKKFNRES